MENAAAAIKHVICCFALSTICTENRFDATGGAVRFHVAALQWQQLLQSIIF